MPSWLTCVAFVVVACLSVSSAASIIGSDDRRAVGLDERHRYRAVGIVAVAIEARVYGGTGTLVNDPLTVLTAFHNVYHDGVTGPVGELKAPLERVYFLIGDRLREHRAVYRVRSISPFRERSGIILPDEEDLAILTLERPVTGARPLSLRPLGPHDDGRSLGEVTHVGFHSDKDAGLEKMIQSCRFRERMGETAYPRSADVLVHDCDSDGNSSGSPFLDESDRVVAVHLGGSPSGFKLPGLPFDASYNFNVARRISAEVQQFVDGKDQTPF